MKPVQISNADAVYLNRLVDSGQFPNPNAALRQAVEYLRAENPLSITQTIQIALQPADNRVRRTQDQWIQYFNELKQQMISAPDLYGAEKEGSRQLLKSLQKDFEESWIISSTRTGYSPNDLSGILIHNFGSDITTPKETMPIFIPVYKGIVLPDVLRTDQGLDYLRNLFDTKDSPKRITKTLEKFADKNADEITIWTQTQENRRAYSRRAVRFCYYGGQFRVSGSGSLDDVGRSRGVSVNPRSGQQK